MILDKPTPAGDYRHRVTIHRRTVTTNQIGETVPADAIGQARWAKVETLTADEQLNAAERIGTVTHKVTIRHTPDLSHVDALDYRGRRFAIKSLVNVDEAGREIVLLAVEVQ